MNSKTVSGLVLPVALLLIVAGLGTGYFLWTESREIFFASRYFRLLDRISDHVEQGMAGRRAVMFSALSGADVTNLATLQHQPGFVLPGDFVEQLTRAQKSNPPVDPVATRTTLTRRQEGGRHWLVASFAGQITNGGSERGRATFEVKDGSRHAGRTHYRTVAGKPLPGRQSLRLSPRHRRRGTAAPLRPAGCKRSGRVPGGDTRRRRNGDTARVTGGSHRCRLCRTTIQAVRPTAPRPA